MADSDPWDDTDHHEIPRSTRRGSLRVSHLGKRSKISDHAVEEKVNDLTSSLRATSEVLSTADRMLDHYRCMNDDQDDEIKRLRSELDRSTEFMHQRRNQKQNHPRSQVRFADQSSPEPEDDLHVSLRDLESEQRKLTKEISKDRDERERIDIDSRRTVRRLEESFQRVEDDLRESRPERERVRKGRGDESDAISRRRAEALTKKEVDAERDILSESVKLAVEKEREIRELRDQLRESRGASQDQEIESKVRRIYDQERSASKEKKEVGKLIEQLKSVKDLMSETASEKKMKEQLKRIKIEEDEIERSDRERRLLKRLQTLDEKLEDAEQERRKLEQALEATAKRLEWSEGGRSTLLKQIDDLSKELKNSDEEKTFISSSLRDCKAKLEESGLLRERLTSRMNSLCKKYENEEDERETLLKQIESLNEKLRDKNRELVEKTKFGKEQETIAKETETKREELKNRALETIKDYKIKCKKNEKETERYKKDAEDVKEELRMFRRRADEESTRFLSLEKEIKEVTHDRDQLKDELEKRSKEVDSDIKNSKKRLNSALDENLNLEEKLASFKEENKHLTQRNQILERKFEEETSRLNQELAELKEGIRDVLGKKSRLEARLKEEQALREEFASSLDEAKEDQAKAKEEVASLYRQLQRERDECNLLVNDAKDDTQKLREQSTEEGQKRLQKQKDEFDETTAEMKLQLADERATVKALRKQQEKDGQEIENMRSQLNRVTEERSHLKQKHDEVQREAKTKAEMREQDKTRISELETEVRRCHRSLNRATDEQKDGLQRVNETLDGLIEKFCEENSLSRPSTLSNRSFIEPQNWASETTEKLKWLEDEMIGRLHSEHGYKDQLNSYQDKVKNAFKKADTEKANLASELDKQSAVLKELVREKKDLEDKDLENQDTITTLQKKVDKLTKYLNSSIKALQASVSAVEDKQRVVDILDNLRGDQEDLDRIRNKYVRSQEQVGLLKRELSDAKTKAEEEKQDTKDVSHISAKLLESLNRLSSPRLAGKHGTKTSFSSRSKPKEEFGFIDFSSSSNEGVTPLKEDHNFKTPDRVSVRDLKRHSRPTRTQARNSSHAAPEKD